LYISLPLLISSFIFLFILYFRYFKKERKDYEIIFLSVSFSVCPPNRLKAGILEPEETVIARQRLATSAHALGGCVFSAVLPVSNALCIMKGKQPNISSQNFLLIMSLFVERIYLTIMLVAGLYTRRMS
jgi:hypothetical protein